MGLLPKNSSGIACESSRALGTFVATCARRTSRREEWQQGPCHPLCMAGQGVLHLMLLKAYRNRPHAFTPTASADMAMADRTGFNSYHEDWPRAPSGIATPEGSGRGPGDRTLGHCKWLKHIMVKAGFRIPHTPRRHVPRNPRVPIKHDHVTMGRVPWMCRREMLWECFHQ